MMFQLIKGILQIIKIDETTEDSKYERDLLGTIKNQFTEFVSVSKKVSVEVIIRFNQWRTLPK